jgi:hypothetical protein
LSRVVAGFSILVHLSNIVALPALGLWLLWTAWDQRIGVRRTAVAVPTWSVPIAASVGVVAFYNLSRFGTLSGKGYRAPTAAFVNPVWVRLYGFFVSSGKSVFVSAPILIASAAGWHLLWRQKRGTAACMAILIVGYLAFHGTLSYWWGGGAWGPRYATVLLPFMLLGLPALLDRGPRLGRLDAADRAGRRELRRSARECSGSLQSVRRANGADARAL